MFDIPGFDATWKVPYFAIQLNYAAGPIEGQGPLNVLLIGLPGTGGNITNNAEIRQVFQQSDVDTACQPGSQLSRMAKAALKAAPLSNIYIAAVPPSAGTKATVTLTLTGSWTAGGTLRVSTGGTDYLQSILPTDTVGTVAANFVLGWNANPDMPFVATAVAGVIMLTAVDTGLCGTQYIVTQDVSQCPAGFLSAIAGSSTIHSTTNSTTMVAAGASSSGTGTESYSTILTILNTRRWARVACGANDSVNAGLVSTWIKQQLAPLVQKYNMAVFGWNGSLSGATSLAQTTLNNPNCQVVASRNCELNPAEIAAGMAALRASVENANPIFDYDGYDVSTWIPSTRTPFLTLDPWIDTEANTLLNAGVTPVRCGLDGGSQKIVRAITTYCFLNGGQDTRCIDIGDAVMASYVAIAVQNYYVSVFRVANPYVQDDGPSQQNDPQTGVATPSAWRGALQKLLSQWGPKSASQTDGTNWLQDTWTKPQNGVAKYPIQAVFDVSSQRIKSSMNIVATRLQHGIGLIINQTGPS